MTEERNAKTATDFCDGYNRHDVQTMMTNCTDDCVAVYPTLARYNKDVWAGLLTEELDAFPDANIRILSLIAQHDKVAVEFGWKGTQKGTYRGVAPTGRSFDFPCVFIIDMHEGKIKLLKLIWNTRLWDLHEQGAG